MYRVGLSSSAVRGRSSRISARFWPILALPLALAACRSARSEATGAGSSATPSSAEIAPRTDAGPRAALVGDAATVAATGPWNVLLLSIDSMRADMPWAGYARPIAPRLTELASRSIVYTHAYALSSFTSKSLGGLMTGRYPSELARTGVFFTHYFDSNVFLCESLGTQGIPCVAGMAHAYLGEKKSGIEQGFTDWREVPGITFDYNKDPYVTSQKLTPLAIEEMSKAEVTKGRFLGWYHFMDPHDEYQHHPEGTRFGDTPRDRYDEEILFTDQWIGKLLDWVGAQPWGAHTVVVVTADHGEFFGEHGRTRHAFELYEEVVHVPLFFVVPGQKPRSIDVPRSHIDLAATFAELLGGKAPEGIHGQSLVPELFGGAPAPARDVVCDLPADDFNDRRRSLLHDGWKILSIGDDERFELYHLDDDPKEAHDRFWKDRDVAKDMLERYRASKKEIVERPPVGGIPNKKK